jgi:hypothetical protein
MPKTRIFGVFLILLAGVLYSLCVWYDIGIKQDDAIDFDRSFGIVDVSARIFQLSYIHWFIYLIAIFGVFLVAWPRRPRRAIREPIRSD